MSMYLLDEEGMLGIARGSLNGSAIPLDKNYSSIRCVLFWIQL